MTYFSVLKMDFMLKFSSCLIFNYHIVQMLIKKTVQF